MDTGFFDLKFVLDAARWLTVGLGSALPRPEACSERGDLPLWMVVCLEPVDRSFEALPEQIGKWMKQIAALNGETDFEHAVRGSIVAW